MNGRADFLAWLGLMLALALEAGLALLPESMPWGRAVAPLIGLGMALAVACAFMRLPGAPKAGMAFALAGAFWLAVMLGMGQLDFATRHPLAAPQETPSALGR